MGFILYLIIGGVIGWLASIVMRTDAQQGIFLNVIVGINVTSLLASFVGAIVLLGIVNLIRRGSVR